MYRNSRQTYTVNTKTVEGALEAFAKNKLQSYMTWVHAGDGTFASGERVVQHVQSLWRTGYHYQMEKTLFETKSNANKHQQQKMERPMSEAENKSNFVSRKPCTTVPGIFSLQLLLGHRPTPWLDQLL